MMFGQTFPLLLKSETHVVAAAAARLLDSCAHKEQRMCERI